MQRLMLQPATGIWPRLLEHTTGQRSYRIDRLVVSEVHLVLLLQNLQPPKINLLQKNHHLIIDQPLVQIPSTLIACFQNPWLQILR